MDLPDYVLVVHVSKAIQTLIAAVRTLTKLPPMSEIYQLGPGHRLIHLPSKLLHTYSNNLHRSMIEFMEMCSANRGGDVPPYLFHHLHKISRGTRGILHKLRLNDIDRFQFNWQWGTQKYPPRPLLSRHHNIITCHPSGTQSLQYRLLHHYQSPNASLNPIFWASLWEL